MKKHVTLKHSGSLAHHLRNNGSVSHLMSNDIRFLPGNDDKLVNFTVYINYYDESYQRLVYEIGGGSTSGCMHGQKHARAANTVARL